MSVAIVERLLASCRTPHCRLGKLRRTAHTSERGGDSRAMEKMATSRTLGETAMFPGRVLPAWASLAKEGRRLKAPERLRV